MSTALQLAALTLVIMAAAFAENIAVSAALAAGAAVLMVTVERMAER